MSHIRFHMSLINELSTYRLIYTTLVTSFFSFSQSTESFKRDLLEFQLKMKVGMNAHSCQVADFQDMQVVMLLALGMSSCYLCSDGLPQLDAQTRFEANSLLEFGFGLFALVYLSSLPVAHLSDAPKKTPINC